MGTRWVSAPSTRTSSASGVAASVQVWVPCPAPSTRTGAPPSRTSVRCSAPRRSWARPPSQAIVSSGWPQPSCHSAMSASTARLGAGPPGSARSTQPAPWVSPPVSSPSGPQAGGGIEAAVPAPGRKPASRRVWTRGPLGPRHSWIGPVGQVFTGPAGSQGWVGRGVQTRRPSRTCWTTGITGPSASYASRPSRGRACCTHTAGCPEPTQAAASGCTGRGRASRPLAPPCRTSSTPGVRVTVVRRPWASVSVTPRPPGGGAEGGSGSGDARGARVARSRPGVVSRRSQPAPGALDGSTTMSGVPVGWGGRRRRRSRSRADAAGRRPARRRGRRRGRVPARGLRGGPTERGRRAELTVPGAAGRTRPRRPGPARPCRRPRWAGRPPRPPRGWGRGGTARRGASRRRRP